MKITSPIRWRRYRSFKFTGARVACNLCGADEVSVVARRDRWLQSLTNVMCQRCGLVYLQPMPDNDELDEFYRHHFWQRS